MTVGVAVAVRVSVGVGVGVDEISGVCVKVAQFPVAPTHTASGTTVSGPQLIPGCGGPQATGTSLWQQYPAGNSVGVTDAVPVSDGVGVGVGLTRGVCVIVAVNAAGSIIIGNAHVGVTGGVGVDVTGGGVAHAQEHVPRTV